MKGVLQYQISGLKSAWQNGLSGEVLRTAIAFPILVMLSFTLCTVFPALRDSLLSMVLSSMESMGIVNEDGSLSALALFSNNLRATVFIMVYGLVPFIQLPALALGVNTMALGVLASWYIAQGYSIVAFLAAVLPHGLAEFPALILAFGVGLYVCGHPPPVPPGRKRSAHLGLPGADIPDASAGSDPAAGRRGNIGSVCHPFGCRPVFMNFIAKD